MLLKRWGANRDCGWTALINKEATVSWNKKDSCVKLSARRVNDPNGNGQYNYDVELSLEEIAKILTVVSEQAVDNSSAAVKDKLAHSTKPLFRLLMASSGLPFGQTESSTA